MRTATLALLLFALLGSASRIQAEKGNTMTVKKITPVLLVDEVEPCVRFWVDRLGFTKTIEVPDGNKLGFVTLQKGEVEIMYQSYASAQKDAAFHSQGFPKGPTFLYVEVEDLDAVIASMKGVEVVMPVRTTFYGAREIGVKDPAGHVVTFAQFAATPQR
jgi:uncharacterized glyoxalase superfamily protein PhnB